MVIKAADRFHTQAAAPNEMWQTDCTYFKIYNPKKTLYNRLVRWAERGI